MFVFCKDVTLNSRCFFKCLFELTLYLKKHLLVVSAPFTLGAVLHFYSACYCRCEFTYHRNMCEQRVLIASGVLFLRGLSLPFTLLHPPLNTNMVSPFAPSCSPPSLSSLLLEIYCLSSSFPLPISPCITLHLCISSPTQS